MSNFFSSADALDAFLMLMVGFFSVLAGLMLFNGNTANLAMLLSLDAFFTTLLTGKQIPSGLTTNLMKKMVVDNPSKLS